MFEYEKVDSAGVYTHVDSMDNVDPTTYTNTVHGQYKLKEKSLNK